eukprot:TRINITY_DN5460_c0_g1_i4.p1 TRINITY_DN5460_c0_g1~~TRINITY_DN5460_c0_g1_i4.p1  ORF type:complete len:261 (+),score=27.78 TRINITY_DN5460_c0_g1_i4:89-871(+)
MPLCSPVRITLQSTDIITEQEKFCLAEKEGKFLVVYETIYCLAKASTLEEAKADFNLITSEYKANLYESLSGSRSKHSEAKVVMYFRNLYYKTLRNKWLSLISNDNKLNECKEMMLSDPSSVYYVDDVDGRTLIHLCVDYERNELLKNILLFWKEQERLYLSALLPSVLNVKAAYSWESIASNSTTSRPLFHISNQLIDIDALPISVNTTEKKNIWAPLHSAANANNALELVHTLITIGGAHVNTLTGSCRSTALHYLVR